MSSIRTRVLSIVLSALVGTALAVMFFTWQIYHQIEEQTHTRLQSVVEVSIDVVGAQYEKFKSGEASEAEAKQMAFDAL